jgi:anti-sigma factor ChrR (cupin superfamily)
MTSTMKRRTGSALVVAAVAAVSYAAGVAQGKPVNMPIANMKWMPAAPGSPLQVAILWGDRAKGNDYGMLLKLPAGSEAGKHAHTAAYHAVNVQGTWVHTNDGDPKAYELPTGSYAMQPGKAMHNDMCKGTTECIIFVHQHGPGDFIPGK